MTSDPMNEQYASRMDFIYFMCVLQKIIICGKQSATSNLIQNIINF